MSILMVGAITPEVENLMQSLITPDKRSLRSRRALQIAAAVAAILVFPSASSKAADVSYDFSNYTLTADSTVPFSYFNGSLAALGYINQPRTNGPDRVNFS